MSANTVVNCAAYCEGRRVANVEIDHISEVLKQSDKFVWIGLHEPSAEMLSKIQREFGLHDLAIEDAHRAHQRPKIEAYGDSLFIVLRTVQMKEQQIELGETHIFIGRNYIITVRHSSSLAYTDVRARCESTPHLLQKGPGFALYAIMDSIRINEMVDNSRDLLSAALEANLSLISISQNEVSKRFAGWAAIIGIPTMVAGIYGMNFKFMPELDWPWNYPIVMFLTFGLCVGLYIRFKRSGWL